MRLNYPFMDYNLGKHVASISDSDAAQLGLHMPPRPTPPLKGSFSPLNDTTTYRDLLLFEERLKTNAASLQRRKSRYQLFLFQLLLVIAFLLSEVLLPPQSSLLVVPYQIALERLLPDIYTRDVEVTLHPYFASGLLLVSVTTLILFFASGMYSEKIAYANKYVPHANRALRSFNMYLNVRKPPLRSKVYLNPLSFFFPRPAELTTTPSPSSMGRSLSPGPRARSRSSSTSLPIPSIPPSLNPRGELIFSSRVDRTFRESYERYRAAFERKRAEKERALKGVGYFGRLAFWRRAAVPTNSVSLTATPAVRSASSSSSSRGRGGGSRSETPPTTGNFGHGSGGIVMKLRERSDLSARGKLSPEILQDSPPSFEKELPKRDTVEDVDLRVKAMERSLNQGASTR